MKTCSVEGCGGKHEAKGLCKKCYLTKWRAENPEKIRESTARNNRARAEDPERRERARLNAAKWYAENPDRARASRAKWHSENAEAANARNSQWRIKNPEKIKAFRKAWRARAADTYIRKLYALPKETAAEVIDVHRIVLQIRRESKK
jgi:hypothetical protein